MPEKDFDGVRYWVVPLFVRLLLDLACALPAMAQSKTGSVGSGTVSRTTSQATIDTEQKTGDCDHDWLGWPAWKKDARAYVRQGTNAVG